MGGKQSSSVKLEAEDQLQSDISDRPRHKAELERNRPMFPPRTETRALFGNSQREHDTNSYVEIQGKPENEGQSLHSHKEMPMGQNKHIDIGRCDTSSVTSRSNSGCSRAQSVHMHIVSEGKSESDKYQPIQTSGSSNTNNLRGSGNGVVKHILGDVVYSTASDNNTAYSTKGSNNPSKLGSCVWEIDIQELCKPTGKFKKAKNSSSVEIGTNGNDLVLTKTVGHKTLANNLSIKASEDSCQQISDEKPDISVESISQRKVMDLRRW